MSENRFTCISMRMRMDGDSLKRRGGRVLGWATSPHLYPKQIEFHVTERYNANMKKSLRAFAVITVALAATFSTVACTQDTRDELMGLTDIRYTGDNTTDLKNLCKIGTTLSKANIEVDSGIAKQVNKTAKSFAKKSEDDRVEQVAQGLEWMTSSNIDIRKKGTKIVKTQCGLS